MADEVVQQLNNQNTPTEQIRTDALYAMIFPPNNKENYAFRGYVKSISSTNSEGIFDILPEHENFVTLISEKITLVGVDGKKMEFELGKAVVEASNNLVKVFIEF